MSDTATPVPRDMPRPDDPLTTCLVVLTRYFHRPVSASTLTAGLPLPDSRLTPELFARAAQRAGFSSQLLRRSLDQISTITLPAVMLLQDGGACVAIDRDEAGNWKVIQPESGAGESVLSTGQLAAIYNGQVIFCRPAYRFDTGGQDADTGGNVTNGIDRMRDELAHGV